MELGHLTDDLGQVGGGSTLRVDRTKLGGMEPRPVSVQFDYATFPVRADTAGRVTDHDGPDDVPIDGSLREDFRRWSADMSLTMNAGALCSGSLVDLNDRGLALARRLQGELGEGYSVEYFDEVLGSFRQLE